MSFRSRRTSEPNPQIIKMEGAVGASGPDTEASVILRFDNYDQDIERVVPLAEIEVRDAYGDAEHNGSGNVRIRTFEDGIAPESQVLMMTHDGRIGCNTESPEHALDVNGAIRRHVLNAGAVNAGDVNADVVTVNGYILGPAGIAPAANACLPLPGEWVELAGPSVWTSVAYLACSSSDADPTDILVCRCGGSGDLRVALDFVRPSDTVRVTDVTVPRASIGPTDPVPVGLFSQNAKPFVPPFAVYAIEALVRGDGRVRAAAARKQHFQKFSHG